jgi:hypothetical protein
MTRTGWIKTGLAATACAAVGAAAGIAGSAAAPQRTKPPMFEKHRDGFRGGPPIHSEAIVPKSGGGFETVTGDSGKLKSRSGNELTITEGTDSEKYKDATVTIPSDATIVRNGKKASLDDLKDGDRIHVMQSPERTFVLAGDESFRPRFGHRPGRPGPGHGPPPPPPFGP